LLQVLTKKGFCDTLNITQPTLLATAFDTSPENHAAERDLARAAAKVVVGTPEDIKAHYGPRNAETAIQPPRFHTQSARLIEYNKKRAADSAKRIATIQARNSGVVIKAKCTAKSKDKGKAKEGNSVEENAAIAKHDGESTANT
jgi:hypothetical protein